jgi:hypothetical protein
MAMGGRDGAPGGGPGETPDRDPEVPDEDGQAAMMREILRRQERHREGGVDPELDETGQEPGPEA